MKTFPTFDCLKEKYYPNMPEKFQARAKQAVALIVGTAEVNGHDKNLLIMSFPEIMKLFFNGDIDLSFFDTEEFKNADPKLVKLPVHLRYFEMLFRMTYQEILYCNNPNV